MGTSREVWLRAAVVASMAVMFALSVSSQSFWIDEANSALKATAPSWGAFQEYMQKDRGSDLQMPLYMASLWAWEKVAGRSEFALRALNMLFALLALFAISSLVASRQIRHFLILGMAVSPMVWAYMDEARPYMLQFAAACLILASLVNLALESSRPNLRDAALFFFGAFLLCGSSLMGVIYTFFLGLAWAWLWLRKETLSATMRRTGLWLMALVIALPLAGLGAYYFWTLQMGARASGVGRTNLLSVSFAAYELLGFSGAGPGRTDLRENTLQALRGFAAPLAAYAVSLGIFLLLGMRAAWASASIEDLRKLIPIFVTTGLCACGIIALGVIAEFRIVGRHFMPLFPFFLLLLSVIAAALWESKKMWQRGVVALLLIASLASSLNLRFSSTHAKDDYRSAAAEARAVLDQGGVVWWAADPAAAKYYGLPPILRGVPAAWPANDAARIVIVSNLPALELEKMPPPSLIILSKTDIYDNTGSITRYIEKNGFTLERNAFAAFSLARKSASGP